MFSDLKKEAQLRRMKKHETPQLLCDFKAAHSAGLLEGWTDIHFGRFRSDRPRNAVLHHPLIGNTITFAP